MTSSDLERLIEHPLATWAIAAALCAYYPVMFAVGKRVFRGFSKERLAEIDPLKNFRMLGAELSAISLVAMLKAAFDQKSDLTYAIHGFMLTNQWVFYGWLGFTYICFVFSPAMFVRYALLERERGPQESSGKWSLFLWRWTLVSWLLGFVNLRIAIKLAKDIVH